MDTKKAQLINKLRKDAGKRSKWEAEQITKLCNAAEKDPKMTAEELEKRVSKSWQ